MVAGAVRHQRGEGCKHPSYPDDTREGMGAANSMHETAPTMRIHEGSANFPNLAVPDTVEDPLPDTELDAWEGNSPS